MSETGTVVRVRASSLSSLFDCPARWQAVHLDGLRLPTSAAAWIGTSLHRSTAVFDQSVLDGSEINPDEAAGALVDALYHPDQDVDWGEDWTAQKAEPIGLALHARYCAEIAPHRHYTAVEALCEALDVAFPDQGITLTLTGTTDRIRQLPDGRHAISDLKSGKRAVGTDGRATTKGHALQLGVYELLAEQTMGEAITAPAEIIGLQTNAKARVGTGEVSNSVQN